MFNADAEPVRVPSLSAPIAGEEESLLLDGAAVSALPPAVKASFPSRAFV